MDIKNSDIIKDYGSTVDPEAYVRSLQGHQYIPQSDERIRRIIDVYRLKNGGMENLLDVGCGPGRLTLGIALEHYGTGVLGLDISDSFIQYAEKKYADTDIKVNLRYLCQDFCANDSRFMETQYDVILMQGVMHHIHGDDRSLFKSKCVELLTDKGIVIVGDEFVKDYTNEATRRHHACKFYLHIIDEARKGGFYELAREEAKNLIDDVLSGEEGAGFINDELYKLIIEQAEIVNESFYSRGLPMASEIHSIVVDLINSIRKRSTDLSRTMKGCSLNRGDRKVSVVKFVHEMNDAGFALVDSYEFGPVQQLGGMGVFVFKKK